MIKVYKLKIGEKVYEVELEDISEKQGNIAAASNVIAAPVVEAPKAASTEGKPVEAPMQGVILSISVAVGDTVSEGDELVVLEAMKMENPILSPYSGTVVEVGVTKGDTVNDGTILVKIA
ncbi:MULTISPECIES: DUF2118 domain-containing protein [Fusobacterium]|uniref:DUF2118 domain-containing protein n=1 Tax=Fusobacterium TaxID=848 RepID=UPI0025BB56B3|nr:DUF2118 domain-containing protein [Fusobacterium sp.]MCI5725670.1 DUF2118 domain-containing protein [Fusobacterium sp.]MDY5305679.1 DUF2118 domain-containing protein [Fusobacterium gastrosuis]